VTAATRPESRSELGPQPDRAAAGTGAPVDAAEFARLFAAEAPRVWNALRRIGVREADLEDVCQEVFLVVHRRWGDFRGDSSIRTWIYGIALRKALSYRRAARVRKQTEFQPNDEPSVAPDQQRGIERAQARRALQAALDKLEDGPRDVFVLFELEQLPMREVAALLELPLQTAYSRLYAARADVKAELQRAARKGGEVP
jgi:RNA polymerase sigma-70 factor (ECF subfamily)